MVSKAIGLKMGKMSGLDSHNNVDRCPRAHPGLGRCAVHCHVSQTWTTMSCLVERCTTDAVSFFAIAERLCAAAMSFTQLVALQLHATCDEPRASRTDFLSPSKSLIPQQNQHGTSQQNSIDA